MAIDFTSGFMPNIKFKGTRDTELFLNEHNMVSFFHARRGIVYGFVTSEDGSMIFAFNEFIYNSLMVQEVSIYEAIPKLIPDGMRYNKELDKLVPDVITDFKSKEYSMTDWANENLNLNIVAFDDVEQDKKEILNNLGHGHKKAKPFISGIKLQKTDNGGNHIAADGTPFDTIEEALNHNCTLIATSSADEYCSGIKLDSDSPKQFAQKIQNHRDYNIGLSNYASMKIQPWDVWKDWKLDPWDADIVKRISRTKEITGKSFEDARIEDYEKIKHICDEKIYQLKEKNKC